jgi:outer membrane scaffolding protein for murein synthesis (MipA/OmpV family)
LCISISHADVTALLNDSWQVFGEALYEVYGSDVSASPLSRDDYEAEIGIGFIDVF